MDQTSTESLCTIVQQSPEQLSIVQESLLESGSPDTGKMTSVSSKQSTEMEATENKEMFENFPEEDAVPIGTGESWQTPVLPLVDETETDILSQMSFVEKTTEAIKKILQEQAKSVTPLSYNVEISEEECFMFESGSSQDTDKLASAIVQQIMEELSLESNGTLPQSVAQSEKISYWKKVGAKLNSFFAQRFAMGSLLRLMTKLRRKYKCVHEEKSSLSQVMEEANVVVKTITSLNEDDASEGTDDECHDDRTAEVISSGHHNMVAIELGEIVSEHLQQDPSVDLRFQIQSEVDTFMRQILKWLNWQQKLQKRKRDHGSMAVKQIREVVCQQSLTEDPSDIESSCKTTVSEPSSIAREAAASDETGDTSVVDEESSSTPVLSVESPIRDEAGEAVGETTAQPSHQWDETSCKLMVIALFQKMMKGRIYLDISLSCHETETISKSLAELFWAQMSGSEVAVKPSGRLFKKVAMAVRKELCKEAGSAEILKMCLLCQDASIYRYVIETLKKHLVTPQKKTGVNRFLSRLFKTVAKPFTACFGHEG